MTAELERRYRRLLRLLPASYRQAWEEDMVSAFLHSTEGRRLDRPPLGERWSVITLAIRLRLAGQHASPRAQVLPRAIDTFARLTLLTWALYATAGVAMLIGMSLWATVVYPHVAIGPILTWGAIATGPMWIAAFVCLTLGRLTASRVLVLLVAGATFGLRVVQAVLSPDHAAALVAPTLANVREWAWLVAPVLAVLLIPNEAPGREGESTRRRRSIWLGAYALGAVTLAPAALVLAPAPDLYAFWNPMTAMHVGLLVGMVLLLALVTLRRPHPHWLLVVAAFGAADAVAHGLAFVQNVGLGPAPVPIRFWPWFDIALAVLAAACAVAGALALRRLPRSVPESVPGPGSGGGPA